MKFEFAKKAIIQSQFKYSLCVDYGSNLNETDVTNFASIIFSKYFAKVLQILPRRHCCLRCPRWRNCCRWDGLLPWPVGVGGKM